MTGASRPESHSPPRSRGARRMRGGLILHRPAEAALRRGAGAGAGSAAGQRDGDGAGGAMAFGDALGALAPPEIALHFEWPGGFRVNGALLRHAARRRRDGRRRRRARLAGPRAARAVRCGGGGRTRRPARRDHAARRRHRRPATDDLLGAWARHMMSWIDVWQSGGIARICTKPGGHAPGRRGIRWRSGCPTAHGAASIRGLDEDGGLLLEIGERTQLIALTEMLEPQ